MDKVFIRDTLKELAMETNECIKWTRIGRFPHEQLTRMKNIVSCLEIALVGSLSPLHLLVKIFSDFFDTLPRFDDHEKTRRVGDVFSDNIWSFYIKQLQKCVREYRVVVFV